MILPVFLWSDLLIYTLIASVVLFLWQLRKNPQAKKRWSGVFASKVGMASFIVILFYILISLLDSMHYREPLPQLNGIEQQEVAYSSEVKS